MATQKNFVIKNGMTFASGAQSGYFLSSDTNGNASWASIPAVTSVNTVSYSGTITANVANYSVVRITLAGNPTIDFTGGVDGQKIIVELIQDATGNRTVSWGTSVRFGSDITSITLSTTGNKLDRIGLVYNSAAGKYDVMAYARGF